MQVVLLDQKWEFENEHPEVDRMFEQLQAYLETSSCHLNYLVIDGVEVLEDSYDYIIEHLADIQMINVNLLTSKQVCDNLLISTEQYISRALPNIEGLCASFYQNPTSSTWVSFNELLEGLQWILEAINSIKQLQVPYEGIAVINEVIIKLQEEISHLSEALNNKDMTLIGDILSYEITPLLESIQSEIKVMIENEVVKTDLNIKL